MQIATTPNLPLQNQDRTISWRKIPCVSPANYAAMTNIQFPPALPNAHRSFIARALPILSDDGRIAGIAAAGSFLTGQMDEFSDLDLIVVTEPEHQVEVLRSRHEIAQRLGTLLAAFTGEHVGEPRLLITLYDSPLLHVDLKFVALSDVHIRVEEPAVLWERDGRVTAAISQGKGQYPQPNLQWIEDRFWIWMHYGAQKLGRGEIFEAIDMINYVRSGVLAPLALQRAGARPQGARRIESCDPAFSRALQKTVPAYDACDCLDALAACIELYRGLRRPHGELVCNAAVEHAVIAYIDELAGRLRV